MASYSKILKEVYKAVFEIFAAVPKRPHLWVHSFNHTQRVVANARRLLKAEAARLARLMAMPRQKFAFLVELSAWLHDLGRTLEDKPSFWGGKFNHAFASAKMAAEILKKLGLEEQKEDFKELALVLQAVREHNQPTPAHPENLVTRLLQDADRGDGFSYQGMLMVLNYSRTIQTPQIEDEIVSKKAFLKIFPQLLVEPRKRRQTLHWLRHLGRWYTGGPVILPNGQEGKELVCPLYTATAKKLFRPGFRLIGKYLTILENQEKK